ncbi:efflux RND transporter periplasmic adaptor subunit [Luteibacter rhizovicinus]|nr:efflux RND transporter periplasmic adaptor subunit [Luteibacter rhizovicinus]
MSSLPVSNPVRPRRSRRFIVAGSAAVLIAIALAFVYASRSQGAEPPGPKVASVPVSVGQAEQRDMPVWVSAIGTVQPLNVVTVKTRVDGQLDKVAFTEGQMVKAGDLLAEIDPRPFQATVDQAQANLHKDDAQRANAELDLQRYAKLSSLQVVPAQQLDAQKAQAQSLLASVASDRGAVDGARLQLGFTRITAPIGGRVGQRLVDQGSQVHATDTTGLVTITQIQPITVTFQVPQDVLPEVMDAQAAGQARVSVSTRDGSRHLADGALVFVDSQVDAGTGQIMLKAQFVNEDRSLWPGEFVAARLLLRVQPHAVVVPSRAVQRDQNGAYVYVVDAQHAAQSRPVRLGVANGDLQVVEEGIRVGDTVVLDGQSLLTPGAKVNIVPSSAVATGAST